MWSESLLGMDTTVQIALDEFLSYVIPVLSTKLILSKSDLKIHFADLEPLRLRELQQFLSRASYAFAALCVKYSFRLATSMKPGKVYCPFP